MEIIEEINYTARRISVQAIMVFLFPLIIIYGIVYGEVETSNKNLTYPLERLSFS